jgi:trehalose 6-phosphate synthase/phosphatase
MRLVIVSNRLPFTVSFKEGKPEFKVSSGGLTTGLWSYLERGAAGTEERPDFLWLGWPGASVAPEDEPAVKAYAKKEFKALPVFLPQDKMDRFYHGFCNKTLWPLFHFLPYLTHYEEDYWEEYKAVNRVCAGKRNGDSPPNSNKVASKAAARTLLAGLLTRFTPEVDNWVL